MLEVKDTKTEEAPPLMFYLRQKVVLINLIIMIIIWATSTFDYYLVGFLIVTFD